MAAAGGVESCSSTSGSAVTDASASDAAAVVEAAETDTSSATDATLDREASAPRDAGMIDDTLADTMAVDAAAVPDASPTGCPTDGGIPEDLSCTGLYSDWTTKTIASDVAAYTPGLVFWSDGAVKSRWIYLPAASRIDTTDPDNWVFPAGTKIWKQFVVELVETRLLWKQPTGFIFLVYRWSADGSSARRLETGETNVNGTTYEIPSTVACYRCHGGRPDSVLGFDLVGLGTSAAQGVTLGGLAAQGRFTQPLPLTNVVIPEDFTGKAAAALGWLHVNCGVTCHNANSGADAVASGLYMKLLAGEILSPDAGPGQVGQLDTYATAVNVTAHLVPNGTQYMRIAPGNSTQSLVPLFDLSRDASTGFSPMPPIVSHVPDTAGVALVTAWIDALGHDP
jgi:hypothetical protein